MSFESTPIPTTKSLLSSLFQTSSIEFDQPLSVQETPPITRYDRLARIGNVNKHPFYSRWASIVGRTQRKQADGHPDTVCAEWLPPSATGFSNFLQWLIVELKQHDESLLRGDFRIKRRKITGPWSPKNCYLQPREYTPERLKPSPPKAKKTKPPKTTTPPSSSKELIVSAIDYMITPVRITHKDIQETPGTIINLCRFVHQLPASQTEPGLQAVSDFVSKKSDEVYLLKNEDGETLLMMYFCRYDYLNIFCVSGVFTTLKGSQAKEAILLAVGLLEDEVDYVNYSAVWVEAAMNTENAGLGHLQAHLLSGGFAFKDINGKSFLVKE